MKKCFIYLLCLTVFACKKKADDLTYSLDSTAEMAQQVGDSMASTDESGGSTSGQLASVNTTGFEKAFARLTGDEPNQISMQNILIPRANAAACNTVAFSACASNQRVRDVTGCTLPGGGTMSGNITLNFTGSGMGTCTIPLASDAVSRVPNFTITGLRGATFAVSATSTGQTVTRVDATNFTFANSGIRRAFTTPAGNTILDVTTSTSSAITVTGVNRASRTMTGGGLTVVNNLTSVSCSLTPNSISWTAGCNCPTAGNWSGTCSDATTFTVAFSNTCGSTTVTKGTETKTVIMDRCQ